MLSLDQSQKSVKIAVLIYSIFMRRRGLDSTAPSVRPEDLPKRHDLFSHVLAGDRPELKVGIGFGLEQGGVVSPVGTAIISSSIVREVFPKVRLEMFPHPDGILRTGVPKDFEERFHQISILQEGTKATLFLIRPEDRIALRFFFSSNKGRPQHPNGKWVRVSCSVSPDIHFPLPPDIKLVVYHTDPLHVDPAAGIDKVTAFSSTPVFPPHPSIVEHLREQFGVRILLLP